MYDAVPRQFDPVVYIDDNEKYVKIGVDNYGWKGIVFTGMIDKDEAIRAAKKDIVSQTIQNAKYAKTVSSVREALVEYGIL